MSASFWTKSTLSTKDVEPVDCLRNRPKRHKMKRTLLSLGGALLCAAMAATAVAQQETKPETTPSEPKQAEPKSDQGDASKGLSPTGPHLIKASDSKTIKATVEDVDPTART